MNNKLTFLIIIIMSFLLVACTAEQAKDNDQDVVTIEPEDYEVVENNPGETVEQIIDLPKTCEDLNGTWINEYTECEYISQEECEYLDGTFDECSSACRHNLEAQACTLQCIPLCSFE